MKIGVFVGSLGTMDVFRDHWLENSLPAYLDSLRAKGVDVELHRDRHAASASLVNRVTDAVDFFCGADAFDLIHVFASGTVSLAFSKFNQTPVMVTCHAPIQKEYLRLFADKSDRVYVVSAAQYFRHPGVAFTSTIHPGFQPVAGPPAEDRQQWLLYGGPVTPGNAMNAVIAIVEEGTSQICLAGPVLDSDFFVDMVQPMIQRKQIIDATAISAAERPAILSAAAGLLLPNGLDEQSAYLVPLSLLHGTPVIVIGDQRADEWIVDGVNGLLVGEVSQLVSRLPQLQGTDRQQIRESASRHFAIDRMTDEYLKLYQSIDDKCRREDHRPWGFYTILSDEADHKVKRIHVYSGKRLSLQSHQHRSEHWQVISGQAIVTRDDELIPRGPGEAVDIPCGACHRIENPGSEPLIFIEIQRGDYFGEDDIERYEDDFGRV